MKIRKITDVKEIENHLRNNTELNLYQIGDLDDFFWKYTLWFGCDTDAGLKQIALLYNGTGLPVLISLCDRDFNEMKFLLNGIKTELPAKFYSHLTKGLSESFEKEYKLTFYGTFLKMSLSKEKFFLQFGNNYETDKNVRRLNLSELVQIQKFYEESYPDNWFDKRMLETWKIFRIF